MSDSLHLSIEMLLKSKYKSESVSVISKIKKINDLSFLKILFQKILDSKNLKEVKSFFGKK